MNVLVPLGTRPEIVKLAPVVRRLAERGFAVRTLATGQHYDPALTDTFFADLGLCPDTRWDLPSDPDDRVGAMLAHALREIGRNQPDLVLLLGDTYTVPLFCLAARRHRVPVAHLEAGLRSFNPTSMEEVDRRVAAATASLHFAPTEQAARFLAAEGVDRQRIHVVGNPVVDALRERGIAPRPVRERRGVVMTAHRPTNVDDPVRLRALADLVARLQATAGPVTFPVHPRTRHRLEESGLLRRLEATGAGMIAPVAYDEMLRLVAGCSVVVTDSGGLQEEASWLGVPVVVLRRSTPRWEGVAAGASVLTGLDVEKAVAAVDRFASRSEQLRVAAIPCLYGEGRTAERVADILADPETVPYLRLDEPDYVGQAVPA